MNRGLLLGVLASCLPCAAQAALLDTWTTVRLERIRLPGDESLGLVGLARTWDLGGFRLGPGLYGAARGSRGGFFTFGLEGSLGGRLPGPLPLAGEAGLFVGGGGGASAPQGGGLMLRPHLGLAFRGPGYRVGLELDRIWFPGGRIASTQAALVLGLHTRTPWLPEGAGAPRGATPLAWEDRELAATFCRLEPAGQARDRSGRPQAPLGLAGVSLATAVRGRLFSFFALEGAAAGSGSGYAQVTGGLGLRSPRLGPLFLEARAGAGLGGGGNLDTGGGALLRADGGLGFAGPRWAGTLSLGVLDAPAGRFRSRTVGFRLARRFSAAVPSEGGSPPRIRDTAPWRAGAAWQVWRTVPRGSGDGAFQLLVLRADRLLGHGLYLTGEAGSATAGGAGGFSQGLVGAGWESPPLARLRLFAEGALGAGGGGGIPSGGGLLAALRAGGRLALPGGIGLDLAAGRVRAPRGALASPTLALGVHVRFRAFER